MIPTYRNEFVLLTKTHVYAKVCVNISHKASFLETVTRGSAMKQAEDDSASNILHKIENIEKEVNDLKLTILKRLKPTGKKVVSLKGILKGAIVSERDISKAKKSIYSKIEL